MKRKIIEVSLSVVAVVALVTIATQAITKTVLVSESTNCVVTDKESVSIKGENQYRVYTTCGTYTVSDSLINLRFDSADVYGSIIPGNTYTFKSSGFRIGLLSMFPNILEFRTEHTK